MRLSRKDGSKISIKVDGVQLLKVEQFSYLGITVTEARKIHNEIGKRRGRRKRSLHQEQQANVGEN
jgi:hypothetical protein